MLPPPACMHFAWTLSPAQADALSLSLVIFIVVVITSLSSHLLFSCVPHPFAGLLWAELWWVAFASTPAAPPPPRTRSPVIAR